MDNEHPKDALRRHILRGMEKAQARQHNRKNKKLKHGPARSKQEREPRSNDWRHLDEDAPHFEKIASGRALSYHEAGRPPEPPSEPDSAPTPEVSAGPRALVLSVAPGRVRVLHEGRELSAELCATLAARQKSAIAVGDEVRIEPAGQILRVTAVFERRTVLSRPDPQNPLRERVLAANVDLAVLVLSLRRPALKPALIDRLLIAVERGGIRPLVCVNKIDLASPGDREALTPVLEPHRARGITTCCVSAESGEGLSELTEALRASTAVFVGHSGVGKSSLLNALDPSQVRETGQGRDFDGKGRHTTTGSTLYDLGRGTRVIDTPGVRAFGLWLVDRADLADSFPELRALRSGCRFRDCRHISEPDCAVRAAAQSGELAESRYAAYLRIYDSLE